MKAGGFQSCFVSTDQEIKTELDLTERGEWKSLGPPNWKWYEL